MKKARKSAWTAIASVTMKPVSGLVAGVPDEAERSEMAE